MVKYLGILLLSLNLFAQNNTHVYEVDLTKNNDAFNVTLSVTGLSNQDSIYSFVSYAPGVHQPLDFGRFIKLFKAYDANGNELIVNKISINDFKILEPIKVSKIVYEIDDSFDMNTEYHPIYPMSGTGINDDYIVINPHGVFGYFRNLKNNPIKLLLKLNGTPKIGTALDLETDGYYHIKSFYELTDSPILIGENLSYASTTVDEIKVEAYVYSPSGEITGQMVLEQASDILNAAKNYIGYSPVDRYTFLMYLASETDIKAMPVFQSSGALEHSYSSTYALPDMPQYLPLLKNVIAHEYMHILSPLHLHSNILANFDYSKPLADDKHVWLYEGVTEWVSYIMQVKSGVVSEDDYLNYLSEKVTNSERYDTNYSLTRISSEWSTDEGNKQYGNIYQLGALTAAMLDIKLLELSNGKRGLREVYLELIKKYGEEKPFDNATFFNTLVDMTYPEIEGFIENHIKNNSPFDFENDMKALGISYYEKKVNPNNPPTLGLSIRPNENHKPAVVSLSADNTKSKVRIGDIITHINGEPLNMSTYKALFDSIKEMKAGDVCQLDIIRNGNPITVEQELITKYDRNVFEFDKNVSDKIIYMRNKVFKNNSD